MCWEQKQWEAGQLLWLSSINVKHQAEPEPQKIPTHGELDFKSLLNPAAAVADPTKNLEAREAGALSMSQHNKTHLSQVLLGAFLLP